jgi:predicted deacylase
MDSSKSGFEIGGVRVGAGEKREFLLKISESYLSSSIEIPVTIIRGRRDGPTAFVTAAIHGDEINGADIVRRLIFDVDHDELAGTLIALPVVNIPGFLNQSRYMPYHRDLNRFFPGKKAGNNADRAAWKLFHEIILKADFGIDLHTAANGRLNLPHVRGDMSHPRVRNLARAFGSTVLIDNPGLRGSLRREATDAGVPTILFEAGETGKFSRKISIEGLRGVLGVLVEAGMLPSERTAGKRGESRNGEAAKPPFQVIVKSSDWIRAEKGGILDLNARPGDLIYEGDLIGAILNPFGRTVTEIRAPHTGIVIGVTTAPLTIPGTGIVHVARLRKTLASVERSIARERKARERRKRGKWAKRGRATRKKPS